MMAAIRRIALTALITALIWSYADQVGETTERIRVNIQIPEDDAWHVVPRTLSGRIVLSGTRRSMQALLEDAPAGELRIEQKADELGLAPGSGSIDLARLVGTARQVRENGLRVVEAEPVTLAIDVDSFVFHEVRVVHADPGAALTVSVTPPQVTARVPSLVWDASSDALYAEFSLDGLRDAGGLSEPTSQDVLLTVPASLRAHPITFDPERVTARVQDNQARVPKEFTGVPIRYVKNQNQEQEWAVELVGVEGGAAGLFSVTLEGPAEIMQQLQSSDVSLELDPSSEDPSTRRPDAEPVERELQLRLSNPAWAATVRFVTEAPKVKFRLRRFTLTPPPGSS